MSKLILLRHGQSVWNAKNIFTGWVDVPLSAKGIEEAIEAGKKIKHIPIDVVFTSSLIRAHMTTCLVLQQYEKIPVFLHPGEGKKETWGKIFSKESEKDTIPIFASWHLNERMYGDLQGLNKAETAEKFGKEQVHAWRRSYDVAPPNGESLKDTKARTIPYFNEHIMPYIHKGKTVLISAHGNSLRSIVMDIENLSPEEIISKEMGTGEPFIYTHKGNKWIRE